MSTGCPVGWVSRKTSTA